MQTVLHTTCSVPSKYTQLELYLQKKKKIETIARIYCIIDTAPIIGKGHFGNGNKCVHFLCYPNI